MTPPQPDTEKQRQPFPRLPLSRAMDRANVPAAWTAVAWVATLASLAATSGCPHHAPIARPNPPPSAAQLVAALGERQAAVTAMNARARATSWLGGDRVRATVLMLVERPGRLRFEAEVSLQGTVAVLATDGRSFAFLDTGKNQLRRGPACPANVASLIRIPLAPDDVAALLLGDGHLGAGADLGGAAVDWDGDRRADVLVVRQDNGWLRFFLQDASVAAGYVRVVGVMAVRPDGHTRWRVEFDDFTDTPTGAGPAAARVPLPGTIRFAEGDASFDDGVEIKLKERTLGEAAAASAFTITPGAGVTAVDVGCAS